MNKTIKALILTAAILTQACSTITFHNGDTSSFTRYGEWHHDGILGLVEFSDPVNMSAKCNGSSWSTIETQQTFVQGLVSAITYSLYDPWNVAYSCEKATKVPAKKL